MNVFAKFDEIPSMILQDIKETKRTGHTVGRSFVRTFGRRDNVKTVYPPTNIVCRGYNYMNSLSFHSSHYFNSPLNLQFRHWTNFLFFFESYFLKPIKLYQKGMFLFQII